MIAACNAQSIEAFETKVNIEEVLACMWTKKTSFKRELCDYEVNS